MLRHLRVTNFAILSDVAMDLRPGFNALTGETGAGKSLIVEAVNLLRGGRASADIPRAGADEAYSLDQPVSRHPQVTPSALPLHERPGVVGQDQQCGLRALVVAVRGGSHETRQDRVAIASVPGNR